MSSEDDDYSDLSERDAEDLEYPSSFIREMIYVTGNRFFRGHSFPRNC